MWNVKKTNLFFAFCLTCGIAICLMLIQSYAKREKPARTDFEFVQADKYFVPPADEVVAILFEPIIGDKDCNNIYLMMSLFGDKKEAEKIIGKKLKPMKLVKGRDWIEKIVNEYSIALKEAEKRGFERRGIMGKIVFITRDRGYVRGINFFDESVIYDNYMESAILREYFKELGLAPFRPNAADKYFIPSKDKTVAIFLYSDRYPSVRRPVALFGDEKLGVKLLYGYESLVDKFMYEYKRRTEEFFKCGELKAKLEWFFRSYDFKPKRVFEGREWLEKIMDAYEAALKQAKEEKKGKVYQGRGSIVFLTRDEGYIREIDVGENTIYDDVTESTLLKSYFDELGLTKKLLAGRPPGKFYVDLADDYFVPPADETVAILLCRRGLGLRNIAVLIGDKELTEKLMGEGLKGKPLEPRRTIEGREWLIKIVNAYRIAIKDAKEEDYYLTREQDAYIWFITPKRGYIRGIGIDEATVYDNYMESEILKKYFDELGLTDELLAGEPNAVP